jgi:hypothetical protein
MKGIEMPLSCFTKEIQDYTHACEHLISESIRRHNQFSEDELKLVKYYTGEVVRTVMGNSCPADFHPLAK